LKGEDKAWKRNILLKKKPGKEQPGEEAWGRRSLETKKPGDEEAWKRRGVETTEIP